MRKHLPLAALMTTILSLCALESGCGKADAPAAPAREVVAPVDTPAPDYGPLFPRVNADLAGDSPDVSAALRDTVAWARGHLEGFDDGSCGDATVVYDSEFTRIFGKSTLGVTLPWMQLYIRDGNRGDGKFLWKDTSLFVSTVFHEFVHSAQRARQSAAHLGTSGCVDARNALDSKRSEWNSGFASLRLNPVLGGGFTPPERALLYRWISPIERARDEIAAAGQTVRWMREHSDELGDMSTGSANNWAYGVQYLVNLKNLATSDCFSPDDDAFAEEQDIYKVEVPQYLAAYGDHESDMMSFLTSHNVPTSRLQLSEARQISLAPTGRQGARCNSQFASSLPQFPIEP